MLLSDCECRGHSLSGPVETFSYASAVLLWAALGSFYFRSFTMESMELGKRLLGRPME